MFAYILICLIGASLAGCLSGRQHCINTPAVTLASVPPLATCLLAGVSLSVNAASVLCMCIASLAVAIALSSLCRRAAVLRQTAHLRRRRN